MRGWVPATLLGVVQADKKRQREVFGQLLNAALERRGVPERGRTTWLFEKLKKRGARLVSREACRKWIRGLDFPDQANLRELCERAEIAMSELDFARSAARPVGKSGARTDRELNELIALWSALQPAQRESIIGVARQFADRSAPETADADAKTSPNVTGFSRQSRS